MNKFRIAAEYQRFGDPDPAFMHRVLQAGKDAGQISDFRITNILYNVTGFSELELIQFTVDVEGDEWQGINYGKVGYKAQELLNQIIHDTDVVISGIGRPDPEAEAQYEAAVLELVADSTWDRA